MQIRQKFATLFAAAIFPAGAAFAQQVPPEPAADASAAPEDTKFVTISGNGVADLTSVLSGGVGQGARYLHRLTLSADFNFDRVAPWKGLRARASVLNLAGGRPNDLAATLQGVDNIELGNSGTTVYEAWAEQTFAKGHAALLVGFADPNGEFAQSDVSSLLIAPSFGMGPELGSAGPYGLPLTALLVRLQVDVGKRGYLKMAVVNARPGILHDQGGINLSMPEGALLIAEGGLSGRGKIAIGLWRQSKRQPGFLPSEDGADPGLRYSQGGYLVVDYPVLENPAGEPRLSLFGRFGLSDGATTPFRRAWQVGALVENVFPGRPDGRFSLGLTHVRLSRDYCTQLQRRPIPETGVELTYSDRIPGGALLQPSVQYIRHPAGDGTPDAVVATLRVSFAFTAR